MNGIRFTSCKSAKDRTSMSITLEQCSILKRKYGLTLDIFNRAIDAMRRYKIDTYILTLSLTFMTKIFSFLVVKFHDSNWYLICIVKVMDKLVVSSVLISWIKTIIRLCLLKLPILGSYISSAKNIISQRITFNETMDQRFYQ